MTRFSWFFLFIVVLSFGCSKARQDQKKKQFLLKGNLSFKDKMYPEAMRYYREAIGVDSSYAQAYNNLGIVYTKMGRIQDAVDAFSDCIALDPLYYEAYFNRANARYENRDYSGSILDFNAIIGNYQPISAIHFGKGVSFFNLYEFDSAATNFLIVLNAEPENIEAIINLGSVRLFQQKFEEAKSLGEKAILLDSISGDALNLLGMVQMNQGDYAGAISYFEQGLRHSPNNAYLLNNKGFAMLMTGNHQQALEDINNSIAINYENPWAYRNKGIWYLLNNDIDNAIRLLKQSINMDRQLPLAHYYLGLSYKEKSQLDLACEAFSTSKMANEKEGVEAFLEYCK